MRIEVFHNYANGTRTKVFEKTYKPKGIGEITRDVSRFFRETPPYEVLVFEAGKQVLKGGAPKNRPKPSFPVEKFTDVGSTQKGCTKKYAVEPPYDGSTVTTPKSFPRESTEGISKNPKLQENQRPVAFTAPSADIVNQRKQLKFISASGCYGVEASSHLLLIDGHCLLLDAGYSEKHPLSFEVIKAHKPEAVFITHAHLDHIGSLPILHRMFRSIPIYMTSSTKSLAYTILHDAMHVASVKKVDLFNEKEIDETLQHVVTVDFNQEFDFRNLKVVFRCAGHILGAAYIIIEGSSKVLYTGDISTSEFLTTPPAFIPSSQEIVDLLISESTYGSSQLPSRESEVTSFCSEVRSVIGRGGRVLIPSFALGRAQEVLTILLNEMSKGNLDCVQVVLDGMARTVTERYDEYSDCMPTDTYRTCRRSKWLRSVGDSQNRERIVGDNKPCVIIASSGMLAGGPSVEYAKKVLTEEKSAILIVGYLDEEVPGKQIVNSKMGEPIELISEDGLKETIIRKCEVRQYRLSAHSDQQGLVRFAMAYEPLAVFLVHGENKAKMSLAKTMLRSNLNPILIPENEEEIDIDRLFSLWTAIKMAEKQEIQGELNVASERFVDDLYRSGKEVAFEDFKQALENAKLLPYCGSLTKAKQTMYALFGWSLKHARRPEGLDFNFPAQILKNGAIFIQSLFGKGFGRRFLYEFERTLSSMFKNMILFDGPIVTRRLLKVSIDSMSQLQFSLNSFESNFRKININEPELRDIQNLCDDCIKTDPETKGKYEAVFVAPTIEAFDSKKEEKGSQISEKKKSVERAKPRFVPSRSRRDKKKEEKKVPTPVVPEGLIGLGKLYGASHSKEEKGSQKPVLEVRETFLSADPTCAFCGGTKLELLRVANMDSRIYRREYRCTDCKLVFAIVSPNL